MIIVVAIITLCWSTVNSKSQLHIEISAQANNSACWYELKNNHLYRTYKLYN